MVAKAYQLKEVKLDLFVGDIYGDDDEVYKSLGLPKDLIAAHMTKITEANASQVDPVSVVQSYLAALAILVAGTVVLLTGKEKMERVVVRSTKLTNPCWFKQI